MSAATLRGFHPFRSEVSIRFDPKVNVLIGPNGTGKSAALGALAEERQWWLSPASEEIERHVERVFEPEGSCASDITAVYVGPTRAPLNPEMVVQDLQSLNIENRLTLVLSVLQWVAALMVLVGFAWVMAVATGLIEGYGFKAYPWLSMMLTFGGIAVYWLAARARRSSLMLRLVPSDQLFLRHMARNPAVSPIFMFHAVMAANRRWIKVRGSTGSQLRSDAVYMASDLALCCAKSIAPEAFPPDAELDNGAIISDTSTRSRLSMWARQWLLTDYLSVVDTRYSTTRLHITSLSSGTQGALLVAWYLALRLASAHNFQRGWEERPAILFIDEIENHFHPTWLRRFIPAFLEHFPNLQIFATTHSPFAIAGLKAGQVHKLLHRSDGTTAVETNRYEIVGWTADEILNEFLETRNPTDLETSEAVEVLRWLEGLGDLKEEGSAELWRTRTIENFHTMPLDSPGTRVELVARWLKGKTNLPVVAEIPLAGEAENWRAATIKEFRSTIGIDVLSGGPAVREKQLLRGQIATAGDGGNPDSPYDHG